MSSEDLSVYLPILYLLVSVAVAIPISIRVTTYIMERAVLLIFIVGINIVVTIGVMSYCAGREDGCIIDMREPLEFAKKNIPLMVSAYIDMMRILFNAITGPAFAEYVNKVYQTK